MIIFDGISISTIRSGKGDCIHLRYIGDSGTPHNIIIDSGPTSTAGEFRRLLRGILVKGEKLDCLIVTHYDDDHIGGILKVGDPGFQDIYFNAYAGAEETGNLSAVQSQRLFHCLPTAKVHSSVLAGDKIEIDGAEIIIHAPTEDMLRRAKVKMKEAEVQLSAISDWSKPFDELMGEQCSGSDTSIANQASVVFSFEYKSTRLLFCGDAWTDSIPCGKYDLVKLPHHGSSRNISDALLSGLDTNTFLICADGTSHPNKKTIAKLIQKYGCITIYSNYSWWMNGFLMQEDMKYIENGSLSLIND